MRPHSEHTVYVVALTRLAGRAEGDVGGGGRGCELRPQRGQLGVVGGLELVVFGETGGVRLRTWRGKGGESAAERNR